MTMADCWHPKVWQKYGSQVLAMFDLSADGTHYTNARQLSELAKAIAKRSSRVENGRKGVEAKRSRNTKKTKEVDLARLKPSLSLANGLLKPPTPAPAPAPAPAKTYCAETSSALVAIKLPLNDDSEYPVPESSVAEWKRLYPAVDVPQELRKMRGWLLGSPKQRKTARGIGKFIHAWLARAQDQPKAAAQFQPSTPTVQRKDPDAFKELQSQIGGKTH